MTQTVTVAGKPFPFHLQSKIPGGGEVLKESILYFTEGSSNKMYRIYCIRNPKTQTFYVAASWGRRENLGTQQQQVKIETQDVDKAIETFNDFIDQKMKKGYTPDKSGEPHLPVDFRVRMLAQRTQETEAQQVSGSSASERRRRNVPGL